MDFAQRDLMLRLADIRSFTKGPFEFFVIEHGEHITIFRMGMN